MEFLVNHLCQVNSHVHFEPSTKPRMWERDVTVSKWIEEKGGKLKAERENNENCFHCTNKTKKKYTFFFLLLFFPVLFHLKSKASNEKHFCKTPFSHIFYQLSFFKNLFSIWFNFVKIYWICGNFPLIFLPLVHDYYEMRFHVLIY